MADISSTALRQGSHSAEDVKRTLRRTADDAADTLHLQHHFLRLPCDIHTMSRMITTSFLAPSRILYEPTTIMLNLLKSSARKQGRLAGIF